MQQYKLKIYVLLIYISLNHWKFLSQENYIIDVFSSKKTICFQISPSSGGLKKRNIIQNSHLEMAENQVKGLGYDQRKNLAKGLVDIALLTANANQLIHAIHFQDETMKIVVTVMISLSIILQVDFVLIIFPLK